MIAGIIPSARGAFAILSLDGRVIRTGELPLHQVRLKSGLRWELDADKLVNLLDDAGVDILVMERVPNPDTPRKGLVMGFTMGLVVGITTALGIEERRYWAHDWRRDLSIPDKYHPAIDRVNDLTERHWPGIRFPQNTAGLEQRLAALLALYAMQCSHVPPPPAAAVYVPELAAA